MKKLLFPIAFVLVIVVAALGLIFQNQYGGLTNKDLASAQQTVGELSAVLDFVPGSIQTGVETTLSFTISDSEDNHPTLMPHHARQVHVLVIGQDLKTFAHLHPEDFGEITPQMQRTGKYSVAFTFPKAGKYLVGIDVMSADGKELSQKFPVSVVGDTALSEVEKDLRRQKCFVGYPEEGNDRYIKAVTTNDSDPDCDDGYQVAFSPSFQQVRPGQEVTLEYAISKAGQPVHNLTPYLDAALHLAIVSEDFSFLSHGHGEPLDEVTNGFSLIPVAYAHGEDDVSTDHHQMMDDHHDNSSLPSEFGPKLISKPIVFPKAGLYQVFGQFKHDGNIIFTNFMVEVQS